jgi:hypothetical protein
MPSVTHRIRILGADHGCYSTSGAIAVKSAFNPVRAAAIALLAEGRDPADKLAGVFEGASISAMPLHRLARVYTPPRVNHKRGDPSLNQDAA